VKPLKISTIVAAAAAAVAAAAILLKDRLIPAAAPTGEPQPAAEPAPPAAAPPTPTRAAADDLTSVKGIGPVYRIRLNEAGITTFSDLADADATTVAGEIDVPEGRVADWIGQAAQFIGH